jgi:hypothetical protein
MSRSSHALWAAALASAFLDGDWTGEGLLRRGTIVVGHARPELRDLVRRVLHGYPRPPWDRPRELGAWICANRAFEGVLECVETAAPRRWLPFQPAMGTMRWPVPAIPTAGELCHFFDIDPGRLAWLADVRSLERSVGAEPLRHYRYRWIRRAGGGPRLLEVPKPRLREVQRLLLHAILDRIPVHPAVHGFVPGRSAVSFARPHAGAGVVIRLDLEDFFSSVRAGRVFGVFRTAGYPESVAHQLTGLTTNAVPQAVWRDAPPVQDGPAMQSRFRLGRRLAAPHLPQGAPTSPALANLCAHRMDRRLAGLAAAFGLTYTRYADDIALSGLLRAVAARRVIELATGIVGDEGFALNESKTLVRSQGERQRLAGIVVNRRPNLERRAYDVLRAILHNAGRDGLESQNRGERPRFAEHLAGRVSWAVSLNPTRGPALGRLLATATDVTRPPPEQTGAQGGSE